MSRSPSRLQLSEGISMTFRGHFGVLGRGSVLFCVKNQMADGEGREVRYLKESRRPLVSLD